MEVSRSFAAVIMELPEELREAVLVFYLVLRGLDSIEDDMTVPVARKCELLRAFHERNEDDQYSLDGVGDKESERDLLRNYTHVCRVYQSLRAPYRAVIKDICRRMGDGMAEFTEKDVQTVDDYELYVRCLRRLCRRSCRSAHRTRARQRSATMWLGSLALV